MEDSKNVPVLVSKYCTYLPDKEMEIDLDLFAQLLKLRLVYYQLAGRTLQYQGIISESEFAKRSLCCTKIFERVPANADQLTHWLMKAVCTTFDEFEWLECCEADCMKLRLGYPGKSFNQKSWLAGRRYMRRHLCKVCTNRTNIPDLDDDQQLMELRKRCSLGKMNPRLDAFLDQPVSFADLKLPSGHLQTIHSNILAQKQVYKQHRMELLSQLNRAGMNLDNLKRALGVPVCTKEFLPQILTPAFNCSSSSPAELSWQRTILEGFKDRRAAIFI
jgi:hypothetical protein